MATLEQAFGESFLDQYKKTLASKRYPRLKMDEGLKYELISLIKKEMNPATASVLFEKDGVKYDIILVKTPKTLQLKQGKGNTHSCSFLWLERWVSTFVTEEQLQNIMPNSDYLLVGKLVEKQSNGKTYLNFRLSGIITLDEVVAYKEEVEKEELDIEKVQH